MAEGHNKLDTPGDIFHHSGLFYKAQAFFCDRKIPPKKPAAA
jgi:hypothetical protein